MYNALATGYSAALTLEDFGLLSLPRQQSKKPTNKQQAKAVPAPRSLPSARKFRRPR